MCFITFSHLKLKGKTCFLNIVLQATFLSPWWVASGLIAICRTKLHLLRRCLFVLTQCLAFPRQKSKTLSPVYLNPPRSFFLKWFSNYQPSQGFRYIFVHVHVDAAARPCARGCLLSSWISRLENKGRLNLSTRLNITGWQWTYGVKQRLCSFSKGVGRKACVIDPGWQWDAGWQSGRT